ncbi:hypothetical protein NC651_037751 [Populus alba x Populus x berolinensis]|nr:hypothetical protein NC651_037751 [Populus alba x Populus x berolinensis]
MKLLSTFHLLFPVKFSLVSYSAAHHWQTFVSTEVEKKAMKFESYASSSYNLKDSPGVRMVCWRWNGIKLLFFIIIQISSLIHIRRITIKQLQLIQRSTNRLKSRLDLSSSAVALSSTDGESAVAAMDIRGSTCGGSFNSCIVYCI